MLDEVSQGADHGINLSSRPFTPCSFSYRDLSRHCTGVPTPSVNLLYILVPDVHECLTEQCPFSLDGLIFPLNKGIHSSTAIPDAYITPDVSSICARTGGQRATAWQ
jgi:hypothetical protein